MATTWFVPTDFPTINSALADPAVVDYDTIRVGPGVYNNATEGGPIVITKLVQLLGAQAGVDARLRSAVPGTESIIEIMSGSGSIQVNRENVVVDGFTIRNNPVGVGINTSPLFSGYWIFNNIIQNNAGGIYLNSNTSTPDTTFSQVKFNLLQANNQAGGGAGGNGIYTDMGTQNLYIESNRFEVHTPAASINFAAGSNAPPAAPPPPPQRNIVIANNQMVNDNSIALTFTTNMKITENMMNNTQGTAIFIAGGTTLTEIEGNRITNSTGNGISVNTVFTTTPVPNAAIRAKNNSIAGNAGAGLLVDAGAYNPTPRRLDATNNWWGSPSGPGPIGTGDEVVDPDGVVEFVPFLSSDPVPPPPPEPVIVPSVPRQASTSTTTFAAASKTAAVLAAMSGTGTLAQDIGNVNAVWPEIHDYEAPNNATLFGSPQIVWADLSLDPGELSYFAQAFAAPSIDSHVVAATVFADNAHRLYIEEYDAAGTLIQSITPPGGLNDGSMVPGSSLTTDAAPPYNWQRLRQYTKVFNPVQAGSSIVITVEALNYVTSGPINPAGVSFVADFLRVSG
ncbi:right-handed parallel beta-helix repeat-containing protein [Paenibacillus xerothermodurans]|uniref:Right handed beta helix domain-containing protein n=1 Tax=Paenibacillus xerothermodurans TaxID=1977292 RepID=A0A2W1N9K7_PAEXE|nr:right-handed parallel beta-helix repeat-containing protein [Paenibacillus xerothermodurans]PZE19841.1 hypothetical protein CBW46_016045 [Paenibacillus xerothermodurans]